MSLLLEYNGSTGLTITATLRRNSDGYWWNQTSGAWESAPAFADRDIALSEVDATNYPGYYASAALSTLGSPGRVRAFFHGATGLPSQDLTIREDVIDISALDETFSSVTWRKWLIRILARIAGNVTGARTGLEKFYQPDGSTESVRVTPDSKGNRTVTFQD